MKQNRHIRFDTCHTGAEATKGSTSSGEDSVASEGQIAGPEGGKKDGKKKKTYSQVHMPSHDQIMQVHFWQPTNKIAVIVVQTC